MKIGTKICLIRQHRHMTQQEFGERIGGEASGANRIAQYEIGYRTPKRNQINKMAHALNVPETILSIEANESLQTLLRQLFWLDQEDCALIEFIPVNEEKCQLPCTCNPLALDHIAIVVHNQAFQNLLTRWSNEKTFLSGGIMDQNDYFGWKIGQQL